MLALSALCIQMKLGKNKVQRQCQDELYTEQELCNSGNQSFCIQIESVTCFSNLSLQSVYEQGQTGDAVYPHLQG